MDNVNACGTKGGAEFGSVRYALSAELVVVVASLSSKKGTLQLWGKGDIKQIFGFTKVRYRGLEKNATRLFVACGLVNLYLARRRLLCATQDWCA